MSKVTQLSEMDRIRLNLDFIKSNPLELFPQFHRRIFHSTYQNYGNQFDFVSNSLRIKRGSVNESILFFAKDVAPRWASNHRQLHENYGDKYSTQQETDNCTLTLK